MLDGIRPLGADLILGGPHYEFTPSGATVYHNSIYLIRHDRVAARYDKMRLLPLAEGEFLGHTLESRSAPFTPGRRRPPPDVRRPRRRLPLLRSHVP